jgi:hypothetical protein
MSDTCENNLGLRMMEGTKAIIIKFTFSAGNDGFSFRSIHHDTENERSFVFDGIEQIVPQQFSGGDEIRFWKNC